MSKVSHNGQHTGAVESEGEVVDVWADVANALALPPRVDIVVSPDERVHDSLEVLSFHVEDEYSRRKLSIAIEQAERHQADQVAADGQQNTTDEVGCKTRRSKRYETGRGENERAVSHSEVGPMFHYEAAKDSSLREEKRSRREIEDDDDDDQHIIRKGRTTKERKLTTGARDRKGCLFEGKGSFISRIGSGQL